MMRRLAWVSSVLLQQRTHRLSTVPIVVLNLNDICNSRCVSCAIWEHNRLLTDTARREMSDEMLDTVFAALTRWQTVQVLLSGGEPTMHPRFSGVVGRLSAAGRRVELATNGLTLSAIDPRVLSQVSAFYISFDAPDPESYRTIRGVDGFGRMADGIARLRHLVPRREIVARSTLQRANVGRLEALVDAARDLGCDRISFLAVDSTSTAFGRSRENHAVDNAAIRPGADELAAMERGIRALERREGEDFVEAGLARLHALHRYFLSGVGAGKAPPVRCNAPWISAVIETSGSVRPCFFHDVIGGIADINGARGIGFRTGLRVQEDSICRNCVCSKSLGARGLWEISSGGGSGPGREG